MKIKDIFRVTRGSVLAADKVLLSKIDGYEYPVYSSQTKADGLLGYYNTYLYENAITWTTDGANAGTVHYRAGKFYCTNVCGVLLNKDGYANRCTAAILGSISKKYVSYVGNPKLMNNIMSEIPIIIPALEEQHKIDSFIAVLDKRIKAQQMMITSLKKYKRGAIAHILSGKDSEFAGEAIWAEKALSDLCCEFRSGRSISATLIHESGDYPVYGGNGIRGYCDHYSHEGEYVVVGRQGALCGNVRLIRGQNYLSEHAIAVRANEENDTKFLLYLLDFMNLGQYSDQGAQPGLAVNKLLRLKCNVPEKKIQSKISAFLLTYDKQIAFQESILSLLTAQRKAFLQQLFI